MLLMPTSAVFAMSVWDLFDNEIPDIAGNETSVHVEVNTGGNSASGKDGANGGTVRTGDASANVDVRTNGNGGAATSSVRIDTTVNGAASSTYYEAPAGEKLEVNLRVRSTASRTDTVETVASSTMRNAAANTHTGNISTDTAVLTMKERMRASLARMTQYVEKIFAWFRN